MAILFTGLACGQRIIGNLGLTQDFFAIENGANSKRLLNVRRVLAQVDHQGFAATSLGGWIKMHRGTGTVSGGQSLPKVAFDTTLSSSKEINIYTEFSSDRAISGAGVDGTPGSPLWSQFVSRMHTALANVQAADEPLVPLLASTVALKPLKLYPGEYLIARLSFATAANNSNLQGWLINTLWTEEDLATFAISGTVTLTGTPVVGAEVMVVIADNNDGLNARFWELVTTTAGGVWSSNIPVGKVAFAYSQNDVTGTLYTAEGRPYLKQ